MATDTNIFIPCICGSGIALEKCCLVNIASKLEIEANIIPPKPKTGVSNNRCLLASTCDCSLVKSREHYLSASVLKQIDQVIAVQGVPWIQPHESNTFRVSSLTSKVFCKRHNEALSSLDTSAAKFFSAIKRFSKSSYDGRDRIEIFNGRDIERWMLKTLYGLIKSKSLQLKQGARLSIHIDERCLDLLFGRVPFEYGRGFFMRTSYSKHIQVFNHISVSPVLNNTGRTLQGLEFNLLGFDFLLSTCPINVEGGVFRPGFIVFTSNTGTKVIRLYWPDTSKEEILIFSSSESEQNIA
ncbi:MAG TPA: hypothetical protein PL103_06545 [Saccharofermentans sp.]|nr:hypothetical protein [Saccharofermentans sp.]